MSMRVSISRVRISFRFSISLPLSIVIAAIRRITINCTANIAMSMSRVVSNSTAMSMIIPIMSICIRIC